MSESQGLTHLNNEGAAQMVNVMKKRETSRRALATGQISMDPSLLDLVREEKMKKGSVLGTARIAAVMAIKKTSDLIPLCHPLPIKGVEVEFIFHEESIQVQVEVMVVDVTGVEMEALTGVSVALLTIYDMCKALSHEMEIGSIYLMEKEGGESGHFVNPLKGGET